MTRKHEFEIEIAAPAELVWKTISEAEGLTRWFAPDARVKPGAGGEVWLSWGPGMEGGEPIAIWDPPHHWQQVSGVKTVDYYVEARAGGGSVLRLVHSGFGADANFDDEYEATFGGWSIFLALLKYGLESHPSEPHKNVTLLRLLEGERERAWKELAGGFQLAANLQEGGAYGAVTPWGESIHGKVIRKPKPYGYLALSVEEWNNALLALFVESCGGGVPLTIMCVLFGEATRRAEALRGKLAGAAARLFPEAAGAPA